MKGKSLLVYGFIALLGTLNCLQSFGQEPPMLSKKQLDTIKVLSLDKMLDGRVKREVNLTSSNKKRLFDSTQFYEPLLTPEQRKKRIRLVTVGNIAGYGGAMFALYNAWYKNYPQSSFHFFDDNAEWLQVDKVGHAWSAYMESKASMELWRWAGLPYKKRVWIGGLSGMVYQTAIETLDGFSAEWGWSWGDFAANCVGSGMLISQELLWKDQRIQFKWSFHTQRYGDKILNDRADSIYGTSLLSRMLKDYNAQTYWLSANIKSFFPKSNVPAWLNVAVGYGAEGMFGAMENKWKDAQGNKYDRTDIDRYRQWYLAPDIDLTKIKTKSKFLKTTLSLLNVFKFPTPSIGFSKKGIEFNWLHF